MTNKISVILIVLFVTILAAISLGQSGTNDSTSAVPQTMESATRNTMPIAGPTPPPNVRVNTASSGCQEQKLAGKRFIKSQTFPIDFKPFEGSCFVTFGSVDDMLDEKDIPRGSTFFIFKDGKQVFELPNAFGGQTACWIEGVSFKDLNGDGLTDATLAGSCLGAKSSYPSNAIYANTGTGFTTNDEANEKLERFKSLKEIETYVKKNLEIFF